MHQKAIRQSQTDPDKTPEQTYSIDQIVIIRAILKAIFLDYTK